MRGLAIYNGKEYVCRDNSRLRNDGTRTKCWLEFRSHTKDDEAFSLTGDGWYTKMVYGEECTEICIHGVNWMFLQDFIFGYMIM